ncbi:MAG: hypothetical protein LBU34_09690 [Planctomycetaceae bacterium]|jgi:hypothetical protein|nr:hypothetical protein [Planctomycetaceae bacterium]
MKETPMKKYVYLIGIGVLLGVILIAGEHYRYYNQLQDSEIKYADDRNWDEYGKKVEKQRWEHWVDKYIWKTPHPYPGL